MIFIDKFCKNGLIRESGRDGRAVDDDVHQWAEDDDVHQWVEDGFSDGLRSGRGGGGTCSAPCYTMFRVCASRYT